MVMTATFPGILRCLARLGKDQVCFMVAAGDMQPSRRMTDRDHDAQQTSEKWPDE